MITLITQHVTSALQIQHNPELKRQLNNESPELEVKRLDDKSTPLRTNEQNKRPLKDNDTEESTSHNRVEQTQEVDLSQDF